MYHPLYSPDLAHSNFHLFFHLNKHLVGKKFDDDDEVQEKSLRGSKGMGIQKLHPRLNKCLDNAGDYVEK